MLAGLLGQYRAAGWRCQASALPTGPSPSTPWLPHRIRYD